MPQSVRGAGMPRPRKPRAASSRMESATWKVANTTMVPMALGMMWRPTIAGPAPAHHPDGLDVLADAQGQRLAPDEPGRDQPAHEGDDQDEQDLGGW